MLWNMIGKQVDSGNYTLRSSVDSSTQFVLSEWVNMNILGVNKSRQLIACFLNVSDFFHISTLHVLYTSVQVHYLYLIKVLVTDIILKDILSF